ncbi:restriction endonuclease subunit S [Mycoplasmopsis agassizii]|uniref:Type I restriction modification DNA specificity domain-containing protein n=1 Tax=Mycoplasmopsis agassizii TaxID=33922 RepID=A0ABX4H4K4_9BACT|nr:restriction endonuclease subunit S [Mycoplasmopsis agassizii]PAF54820.1 hypothetical protein CJF60_03735 [Mycoplasmopsis agassizii]SMC18673.1 Type I restriction modification DNA specificity domain-containing protein [Mycoplasmopsis agassizii]
MKNNQWKTFSITKFFKLELSKGDNKPDSLPEGRKPLVSAGTKNNGYIKFIREGDGKSLPFKGNAITVDMFGKPFYQEKDFYAVSHGRINILTPLIKLSKFQFLFIVGTLEISLKNIFSYNRMCSQERLRKTQLVIPVTKDGNPDWDYMENFIKEIYKKQARKVAEYYQAQTPEIVGGGYSLGNYKDFTISSVFQVSGTETTHPSKLIANGKVPRITCSSQDNGFDNVYQNQPTEKGSVITIDSATDGIINWQPTDFIATDHVEKISFLDNKIMNKYLGLFIKTSLIVAIKNKYGYGYKFSQKRIRQQKLLLPIDKRQNIDYSYMENQVKNILNKKANAIIKYYSDLI